MAINRQGFGIQLATPGFSLEANTIFTTYADALVYAQSSAAYVGKVISIIEGDKKGIYSIEAIGENASFSKIGSDVDLSNYVTKDQLTNVYVYKGSKATFSELPVVDVHVGDVWNVEEAYGGSPAGTNWVWNGDEWDALSGSINLSAYALKSEVEAVNEEVAKNTAGIIAVNNNLSNKVDKVDGYSLIPNEKLTLIDNSAAAIGQLFNADSNFENRIKALEENGTGGGDLTAVTSKINEHESRIGTLESENTNNKAAIGSLLASNQTFTTQIEDIVNLNTQQTGQIAGLTSELSTISSTVNTHTSNITTLNTVTGEHTDAIAGLHKRIDELPVKSVKVGDKILSSDANGALSATLSLGSYTKDDGKTYIGLAGIEGAIISEFDATSFVRDGMIDSVVYNPETQIMTITWNTDAGKQTVNIPMSGLVDSYKAGSGLLLVDNTFSTKLSQSDNNRLTLAEDGSLLVDISKDIANLENTMDSKINAALAWIDVTE